MTQQAATLADPAQRRRRLQWAVLAASAATAALGLLWWVDPRPLALPLCAFHHATGLHCPGCGATRATHELLHGRMLSALHDNALWILALPLIASAAASATLRGLHGQPLPGRLLGNPWFFVTVAAVALVFGVLRNVPSYPFTLLVPPG